MLRTWGSGFVGLRDEESRDAELLVFRVGDFSKRVQASLRGLRLRGLQIMDLEFIWLQASGFSITLQEILLHQVRFLLLLPPFPVVLQHRVLLHLLLHLLHCLLVLLGMVARAVHNADNRCLHNDASTQSSHHLRIPSRTVLPTSGIDRNDQHGRRSSCASSS